MSKLKMLSKKRSIGQSCGPVIAGFVLAFAMVLFYQSCYPTKADYLREFESLITELRFTCQKNTADDWDRLDKKFLKLSKTMYKKFNNDLTLEERFLVWRLCGEYYLIKTDCRYFK